MYVSKIPPINVIGVIMKLFSGVVGREVTVSNRCVVGAGCEVVSMETLPEDTIIYGSECRRYHKKAPLQVKVQGFFDVLVLTASANFFFADHRSTTAGISY